MCAIDKWRTAHHCRFMVERGDLILIEELPAAGNSKNRDLRPLSVQESLELLVRAEEASSKMIPRDIREEASSAMSPAAGFCECHHILLAASEWK